MAKAKTEAAGTSKVFIRSEAKGDIDKYVGTPKRTCLIQTDTEVEVPADVREALDLSAMQKSSADRRIEELRIKDDE